MSIKKIEHINFNTHTDLILPLNIDKISQESFKNAKPRVIIELQKANLSLLYHGKIDSENNLIVNIPPPPINMAEISDNVAMLCVEMIIGSRLFLIMETTIRLSKTKISAAGGIQINTDGEYQSNKEDGLLGDDDVINKLEDEFDDDGDNTYVQDDITSDVSNEPLKPAKSNDDDLDLTEVPMANAIDLKTSESPSKPRNKKSAARGKPKTPKASGELKVKNESEKEEKDKSKDEEKPKTKKKEDKKKEDASESIKFYTVEEILERRRKNQNINKIRRVMPNVTGFVGLWTDGDRDGYGDRNTDSGDGLSMDTPSGELSQAAGDFAGIGPAGVDGGGGGDAGGGVGETDLATFQKKHFLGGGDPEIIINAKPDPVVSPEEDDEFEVDIENKKGHYLHSPYELDDSEFDDDELDIDNDEVDMEKPELPSIRKHTEFRDSPKKTPKNKLYFTLEDFIPNLNKNKTTND